MLNLDSFKSIRSWNGSQDNAFEELCYQLRDPQPERAVTWKLGNPDRGYEWYVRNEDDSEWGWQVKYIFSIDNFLKAADESLTTVTKERPNCLCLTFCIPFDLPDVEPKKKGVRAGISARQKFENWVENRGTRIPGSERIKILLWSGGDVLERLNSPENRGRAWFFWDQEVLSLPWCRQRIDTARTVAGPRYSPELHIQMPISSAIEGLARTAFFRDDLQSVIAQFNRTANSLFGHSLADTGNISRLSVAVLLCRAALKEYLDGDGVAVPDGLTDALHQCAAAVNATVSELGSSDADASVNFDAGRLLTQLETVADFIDSPSAMAARDLALLITGDAGQGKTHLLVDAAYRLVEAGQPAVLVLGSQLSGRKVLNEIADSLGIGSYGWTGMLQAMAAAAEAYGQPFVLFIDAINETDDPRHWQQQLAVLRSEIRLHSPWIVLGMSIRSTYIEIALGSTATEIPNVEHEGFAGVEEIAAEKFFEHFGLPTPLMPIVNEGMSNPLFLKLYCQALASGDVPHAEHGTIHISALFNHYLQSVNKAICTVLQLDADDGIVQACAADLAGKLAKSGNEWIRRDKAKKRITRFADHLHAWPQTLFGQLLSEGLLSADIVYTQKNGSSVPVEVIRFSYQRFADYMIAERILSEIADASEVSTKLAPGRPLHAKFIKSSAGVIEALSVLLPEKFEVELLETSVWELDPYDLGLWQVAFLNSLPARRADAITHSTVRLLEQTRVLSRRTFGVAAESMIALSIRDIPPLDSGYLHRFLDAMSMPERDATWGIALYHKMNTGQLGRISRWAAGQNHGSYSVDTVRCGVMPLVWTLGSPHRPMRDHITKSLVRLLSPRLDVLAELLEQFAGVDDAYIFQRLCVIAHGAVLTGGATDSSGAAIVVRCMASAQAVRGHTPDLLARDALRGVIEWCLRHKALDQKEVDILPAPPRSSLSLNHATEDELIGMCGSRGNPTGRTGFESIIYSVFGLGDFGVKIVEPDVRFFSFYPLENPYPQEEHAIEVVLSDVDARVRMQQLSDRIAAVVAAEETPSPERGPEPCQTPTASPEDLSRFPAKRARAWIFQRVLELGWTPELFAEFDSAVPSHGRDAHKPERFGKKYQWIALHELIARIADNYHPRRQPGDQVPRYLGPWQLHERDIDPTLPPSPLLFNTNRKTQFDPTFPCEHSGNWWPAVGPIYSQTDPPADAGWAASTDDILDMKSLVKRTAPDGSEWIVLHATHHWREEDPRSGDDPDRNRRDQWSHIYSWIVNKRHTAEVYRYLSETTLMGRWMPQGQTSTSSVYLGEMPWSLPSNEYPQEWESEATHPSRIPQAVYPTWNEYCWESVTRDCSIDEAVHAWLPSLELFKAGQLIWKPSTREWLDSQSLVAAQYLNTLDEEHAALLVRADWLVSVIAEKKWSIVFGRLGEKQLHSARSSSPGMVGEWTEIDGTAILYNSGNWKFGEMRTERCCL